MKRVIIVVVLISLILLALFLAAKPGNKSPIAPQSNIPQPASPSVTEELPPTPEQQEALIEASSTLSPAETTSAQLTDKTNIVEYKLNGATEWKNAQINQKFVNGDTLRTGADSEAQLSFSDGSTVRLNGLTQITINPADKEIHLSIGKIFVSFFKGTSSPKVVTPNAVAAALGTMWVQEQREDGTSQINVLEGQVNFTSEGTSEIVDEGNFTKALPKKSPVKPQKFNIDNYAQSERVLEKVKLKKLAELHKKHDEAFYKKLEEHPELKKKIEQKMQQLKVEKKVEEKKEIKPQIKEKIEDEKEIKKELIEKKLGDEKELNTQIKEKIEDKKLQQNDNIKKQLEEKKSETIEKKKELIQEKKQQIQKEDTIKSEEIKKKIIEEKKKQQIQEKLEEKKLQQNENIKKQQLNKEEVSPKPQELKKKQLEEKKSQMQEENKKKILENKKEQLQQNPEKKKIPDEKRLMPNQSIKQ